jgi:hypothetical protein
MPFKDFFTSQQTGYRACVPVALNICSHNPFASSALNLIFRCKTLILTVPNWLF